LIVSDDRAPILHGYLDTGFQKFLASRDVIGHVTIGLGI